MDFDLQLAKQFVKVTHLPSMPMAIDVTPGMGMPALDKDKKQSLVVGSNVVSFTIGVEADVRQAIADSSLFAQLAASKTLGSNSDPVEFFDTYFSNLYRLGWIIQEKNTEAHTYAGRDVDVHEAIIGVITTFLSPVAGAAAAVIAVLNGLHQMNKDAPFITLFNQQSQQGSAGRFQFTYVYPDPTQGLMARAMAFSFKANSVLTQVLFFKVQNIDASLHQSTGSLSIDADAMKALRPQLAKKMNDYRSAFIAGVEL